MRDDGIDRELRARTLTTMRLADRIIGIKLTLYAIAALAYALLAWARAIDWWLEIGCSVHSLQALFVESLGVGISDGHFSVAKMALAMLVAAMLVLTDKMGTRR